MKTPYKSTHINHPCVKWASESINNWPYYDGSTVWISATGGSTVELHFWFRYGGIGTTLQALYSDGHEEPINGWWFEWEAGWTERVVSATLAGDVVGDALEFDYHHPQAWTNGLSINSNGNIIQGYIPLVSADLKQVGKRVFDRRQLIVRSCFNLAHQFY